MSSGGTEIPVDGLMNRMRELDQMDRDGETGYQNEFNVSTTACGSCLNASQCVLMVCVMYSAEVASVPCQH